MPSLRELLKKKANIEAEQAAHPTPQPSNTLTPPIPEFTFVRTTTHDQEVIAPPTYPDDNAASRHYENANAYTTANATLDPRVTSTSPTKPTAPASPKTSKENTSRTRRLSNLLHRSPPSIKTPNNHQRSTSGGSTSSQPRTSADDQDDAFQSATQKLSPTPASAKRLSQRLHLRRSRSGTTTASEHVPEDLPDAPVVANGADKESEALAEAKWEKRATLLVEGGARSRSASASVSASAAGSGRSVSGESKGVAPESGSGLLGEKGGGGGGGVGEKPGGDDGISEDGSERPAMHQRRVSDQAGDVSILEAIRLHESGSLTHSTAMFSKLADPLGANNALAQVLYALALRHGWGVEPDPPTALTYLTHAASSAASIESAALSNGSSSGGAAKGELVLAIYELANCFRHGWGVERDAVAARQYYETAANLGDTDAMGEVAWCYLEGFGGKKDKFRAAGYLRRREKAGVKVVGESWIWKEKYDPK